MLQPYVSLYIASLDTELYYALKLRVQITKGNWILHVEQNVFSSWSSQNCNTENSLFFILFPNFLGSKESSFLSAHSVAVELFLRS